LHKWFYAPKSVAFLHVSQKFKDFIHHPIVGTHYEKGFEEEFFWPGARNFSSKLAVKASIEFRECLGDEKIMNYMHELAWNGANEVAKIWKTYVYI